MLEVSLTYFRAMLIEAAEIGAMKVLVELGHLTPYISKSEAYKMYGRANVDRWVLEGLVNLIKDGDHGAKICISQIEIEATAKTSNRITYRSVGKENTKAVKNNKRASAEIEEQLTPRLHIIQFIDYIS